MIKSSCFFKFVTEFSYNSDQLTSGKETHCTFESVLTGRSLVLALGSLLSLIWVFSCGKLGTFKLLPIIIVAPCFRLFILAP
ncbi:hypothetical protein POUND7_016231, partial [Theobroma cacao]